MNTPDKMPAVRDGKALRERFFELIASGVSPKKAGIEVGISDRSRTRFLQERRQQGQVVEVIYPVEDIKKFADNGHRIEDIATRFTLTARKLRELATQHGFKFVQPNAPLRPVQKLIDLAEVKRLAAEGYSRSGIATMMSVDRHRMHDFIRDNNIEITWNSTQPRLKIDSSAKKAAQAKREQDHKDMLRRVQTLLMEGKNAAEIAIIFDKSYDFMYRLIRNNNLRQPTFVVPEKMRASPVMGAVGKVIVQRDTSMSGDRPCITCGQVFRSWHKRNNQRCERCKARED